MRTCIGCGEAVDGQPSNGGCIPCLDEMSLSAQVETLRALLREAIEDLDGLPADPHSWLGRVRATLGV